MKIRRFSDEDLMKFADGELNNKELSMDILSELLEDTPESKVLSKRLDVFTSTRNALINSLIDNKSETKLKTVPLHGADFTKWKRSKK